IDAAGHKPPRAEARGLQAANRLQAAWSARASARANGRQAAWSARASARANRRSDVWSARASARASRMDLVSIAPDVRLGRNLRLSRFLNLYGCTIGDETTIGAFVEIQKNATVGRRCKISSHTFICEGV